MYMGLFYFNFSEKCFYNIKSTIRNVLKPLPTPQEHEPVDITSVRQFLFSYVSVTLHPRRILSR